MTVLITGANRGIGRAMHDAYAAAGEAVIGTTRGAPKGADWLHLDVTDPGSVDAMAKAVGARRIDLLVCNAGLYGDKGHRLEDGYPPALWAEMLAVNVTGVFLTVQALLPKLAPSGKIAILSSQMASHTRAPGGSYIYRASKAAVLNLGRNLAADLASQGISVGIYHPGWVRTDMGGSSAEISADTAARGLMERFAALSPATSGCFETWDGRPHPY